MIIGRPIGSRAAFGLLRESALMTEEPTLALDSARIAGEPGIAADEAMAGNDDRHGIQRVGMSHRGRRGGTREAGGEPSIARGLARRYLPQRSPDRLLEKRAAGIHRERVDGVEMASEVRLELFADAERIAPATEHEAPEAARQLRGPAVLTGGEFESAQGPRVRHQRERTDRRIHGVGEELDGTRRRDRRGVPAHDPSRSTL